MFVVDAEGNCERLSMSGISIVGDSILSIILTLLFGGAKSSCSSELSSNNICRDLGTSVVDLLLFFSAVIEFWFVAANVLFLVVGAFKVGKVE